MTNLIGLLNILLGKCAKLHLHPTPNENILVTKRLYLYQMEFVFGGQSELIWDNQDILGVLQQGYIGVVSFSYQD
jgi:hypothetical protein